MGCGCRGGSKSNNGSGNSGDLKKFGYLSPRQLKKLKEQEQGQPTPDNGSGEQGQ